MAMAGITERRPLTAATAIMVVICAVGLMAHGVAAQPSPECSLALINLTPCLNFTNGTSPIPTQQCCDAVTTVVNVGITCLCELITTGNIIGFTNRTLTISLPGLCKIVTEPLNKCEGVSDSATSKAESSGITSSPASSGSYRVAAVFETLIMGLLSVLILANILW
eukprot:Gb_06123 [translate_table: standard]